jgi:phage shock protein A
LFAELPATHYCCAMLKDLQSLFQKTWGAFRAELGRREPEDEVAELLGMMRREMVDARAALPVLEDAIRSVDQEIERERRALADCDRRAGLAERIGDAETVRIAHEFAERHREHLAVLEKKRAAAVAERDLRTREVRQMSQRYKEADANRFVLLAELRRQRASDTMRETLGGGAFRDFSRMEDSVADSAAYAEALQDLEDDLGPAASDSSPRERVRSLEERLEELKRKMGKG